MPILKHYCEIIIDSQEVAKVYPYTVKSYVFFIQSLPNLTSHTLYYTILSKPGNYLDSMWSLCRPEQLHRYLCVCVRLCNFVHV